MIGAVPTIAQWMAPATWHTVDFLSDLHLDSNHPATLCAFAHYLETTPASAVFLLGDIFEVWPGDDALIEHGSFESTCCTLLARAALRCPLFFMHGNRDFLVGHAFTHYCRIPILADPTVLVFAGQRWLLSHGDALCLADTEYQRFRTLTRQPQWQAHVLSRPLTERRALARSIRNESHARKESADYADVDTPTALQWLHAAGSHALIHGHTHRPANHHLAPDMMRYVLTDWDADTTPPRAEILRLNGTGLQRVRAELFRASRGA